MFGMSLHTRHYRLIQYKDEFGVVPVLKKLMVGIEELGKTKIQINVIMGTGVSCYEKHKRKCRDLGS